MGLIAVVEVGGGEVSRRVGGHRFQLGQRFIEDAPEGVALPEPVDHVLSDRGGRELLWERRNDVVGKAVVGDQGGLAFLVAAGDPVFEFGGLSDGAVPAAAGVDRDGQPVDSGSGPVFGKDRFEHLAGACPFQALAVTVQHRPEQLAFVLRNGKAVDPCAGGQFTGQVAVPVCHAGAALGGLQVVPQPDDQEVGVDTVFGEAQVADRLLGRSDESVGGAAADRRTHGAPQRRGAEPQARSAGGQNRAES